MLFLYELIMMILYKLNSLASEEIRAIVIQVILDTERKFKHQTVTVNFILLKIQS